MNPKLFIFLVLVGLGLHAQAQQRMSNGQFFQNLSVFSPALTGQNDFSDITIGYRHINIGFENKPTTLFLNANTSIAYESNWVKNLQRRTSSWTGSQSTDIRSNSLKIGLGGYLVSDEQGFFRELEGAMNVAVHVPVQAGTFLSLGFSLGLANNEVDLSRMTVNDQVNDFTYLSYLQNGTSSTFFNIGSGISLYSRDFFISYGIDGLSQTFISGNRDASLGNAGWRHHVIGGYTFQLNPLMELIPAAFLRMDPDARISYDLNIRWRYRENLWVGVSYGENSSYLAMVGYSLGERINFGYAYGFNSGDNEFNNNSHELVFGIRFSGDKRN